MSKVMQSRLLFVCLLTMGVFAESPGQTPLVQDENWARLNKPRTMNTSSAPMESSSEPQPIEAWIIGGIVGAGFMIARSRKLAVIEAVEEREATHPSIPGQAAVHMSEVTQENTKKIA